MLEGGREDYPATNTRNARSSNITKDKEKGKLGDNKVTGEPVKPTTPKSKTPRTPRKTSTPIQQKGIVFKLPKKTPKKKRGPSGREDIRAFFSSPTRVTDNHDKHDNPASLNHNLNRQEVSPMTDCNVGCNRLGNSTSFFSVGSVVSEENKQDRTQEQQGAECANVTFELESTVHWEEIQQQGLEKQCKESTIAINSQNRSDKITANSCIDKLAGDKPSVKATGTLKQTMSVKDPTAIPVNDITGSESVNLNPVNATQTNLLKDPIGIHMEGKDDDKRSQEEEGILKLLGIEKMEDLKDMEQVSNKQIMGMFLKLMTEVREVKSEL